MSFQNKRGGGKRAMSRSSRYAKGGGKSPEITRYHAFSEDSPDCMMLVEASGRFIAMNAQARRLLGYSHEDLPRLDLDAIGASAVRARFGEVRRIVRSRIEGSLQNKDGKTLPTVFNTAAIGDGSFQFVLTEPELRPAPRSETSSIPVDRVLENAPLPVLTVELGPSRIEVIELNREARSLAGLEPGAAYRGRDLAELLPLDGGEIEALRLWTGEDSGSCERAWSLRMPEGERRFKTRIAATEQPPFAGRRLTLFLEDITAEGLEAAALAGSIREKSILLQEVQHRVKNSLTILSSMLALEAGAMRDAECAAVLIEAQSRIKTISLLHDRLTIAHDDLRLRVGPYLRELVAGIEESYLSPRSAVRIEASVDDLELDTKRVLSIGLIVNELVINSLKHAFPARQQGLIRVGVAGSRSYLDVSVSDDGVGLPEGIDWQRGEGMGLKFVDMLARQLTDRVEIDGTTGFRFAMKIPI